MAPSDQDNILRPVHRLSGRVNRGQHRRKIFVPVIQEFDLVAFDGDWIGQGQSRTEKLRITD